MAMRKASAPGALMAEPIGSWLLFPSADELLAAIRGHHLGEHRLSHWARQLGSVYERLLVDPGAIADIGSSRTELIVEIDQWVAARLPVPHPNAHPYTETIGAVLNRLARTQVYAYQMLMTVEPGGPAVHAAWFDLAQLVVGYTDLTTAILHRSCILPAWRGGGAATARQPGIAGCRHGQPINQ